MRRMPAVGDEQHGLSSRLCQSPDERHNVCSLMRVEVPRRLIRQQEARSMHQSPRYRHALLFAAGQLAWPMMSPMVHPDHVQDFIYSMYQGASAVAAQHQRKRDVFLGREPMDQMERLKDNSDGFPPDRRPFLAGQVLGGSPIEQNVSRRGYVQARNEIQERALAAAARPYEGAKFSPLYLQIKVVQRDDGGLPARVGF